MNKPMYVLAESFKFSLIYPLNQSDIPDEFRVRDFYHNIVSRLSQALEWFMTYDACAVASVLQLSSAPKVLGIRNGSVLRAMLWVYCIMYTYVYVHINTYSIQISVPKNILYFEILIQVDSLC